MVRYAISTWGADANRVFVTGTSSGAMMTNVLIGAYPDVFKGGAAFSGVPYGCFAGSGLWNSQCAQGQLIKTAQQWGDQVRSGYPGYTGARPKMQVWHGTTDTTLYPQNFFEEIKQWTNVFGYSQTPVSNSTNTPLYGYSKSVYGPNFQAILAQGVGHTVPERAGDVLAFFGLDGTVTTTAGPTTTRTTSPTTSTPTPTSGGTVPQWGQCGGQGWTGATVCVSPYTCTGNLFHNIAFLLKANYFLNSTEPMVFSMYLIYVWLSGSSLIALHSEKNYARKFILSCIILVRGFGESLPKLTRLV
jgi:acetylxylan esterase